MSTYVHKRLGAFAIAALAGIGVVQAETTFVIGAQVPLTGALARVGTATAEGIKVAIDQVNAEHKGKYRFELKIIDDESNPAKAIAAVEKLIADGAVALTGGYGSNNIGPASEAAAKAGKVYMTSGGVSPELTKRNLPTFFRINNTYGYSRALVGLFQDMDVKKVSVVYSNKEATQDLAKQVAKELGGKGVKVSMHEFDAATSDFTPLMNKIRLVDRPEAVAMVGYENDYIGILRASRTLKLPVKAMAGVWSLATSKMNTEFNDLVQNVYGTSILPYPVEFTTPEAKQFAADYQRINGKEPDYLGQFGHVQTSLLLDAIVRAHEAGTLDKPNGLADELRKTDAQTLIGRVAFDANGDNPYFQHRIGQHQGDKVVLVYPSEDATGTKSFPGVPW